MDDKLDYAAMGARIRQAREEHRMTQEQLGEACSLSTAHIGHVERGTRTLSIDTLYRMSRTLHISTDYMLFGEGGDLLTGIQDILQVTDADKAKRYRFIMQLLADHIDNL